MNKDYLKQRVINAKKRLPVGIVPLILNKYPKYNTPKGITKVTNVIHLRSVSEPITKKLEALADLLEPSE